MDTEQAMTVADYEPPAVAEAGSLADAQSGYSTGSSDDGGSQFTYYK